MRIIGWQGFTLETPESCDLTGYSGDFKSGYFRVDDSEELSVEIRWGTESERSKKEPDPEARRDTYFQSLQKEARKKKLSVQTKESDAPKRTQRPERLVSGFTWTGDKKAYGVAWYCRTCRRMTLAQVMGPRSGKSGIGNTAEAILGSIVCHSDDPEWRVWAIYDLQTQIPAEYDLVSQQLMNVYLRLTFARGAARLSVEQWSLANVARRGAYLDLWLAANAKGEMRQARYTVDETETQGHPAIALTGGPAFGTPMMELMKQASRMQMPATRFSAQAWECEDSNKLYLIEGMRTFRGRDWVGDVVRRTLCHTNI